MKQSWPNLRLYSGTYMEGLGKTVYPLVRATDFIVIKYSA